MGLIDAIEKFDYNVGFNLKPMLHGEYVVQLLMGFGKGIGYLVLFVKKLKK